MWVQVVIDGVTLPYEVDENGNVRRMRTSRLLKHKIDTRHEEEGYHRVNLQSATLKFDRWIQVHRLVATAFIPNPHNFPEVNHRDGNKGNNYVGNLQWCTTSENQQHALETGLRRRGEDLDFTLYSENQIRKVCELIEANVLTFGEISEITGVSKANIKNISRRKNWTHVSKNYNFPRKKSKFSQFNVSIDESILQDIPRKKVIKALQRMGLTKVQAKDLYKYRKRAVERGESDFQKYTVFINDGVDIFKGV